MNQAAQTSSPPVVLIINNPAVAGFRMNRTLKIARELEAVGWHAPACNYEDKSLRTAIMTHQPQLLFTISFYPQLSALAKRLGLTYLVWDFDKIMNLGYFDPALHGPHNILHMACIDDTRRLLDMGLNACFLPAVPDMLLDPDDPLTEAEQQNYGHDITFIGASLAQATNDYQAVYESLTQGPKETQRERADLLDLCERAIEAQAPYTRRNVYHLPEIVTELLADTPYGGAMNPDALTNALAKECCRLQRQHFLEGLNPLPVDVYGPDDWSQIETTNIRYRGFAQYDYQTGKIFRASKINLNLQRIYAMDGFSNRVFNVLSQGGFLITNRSPKLASFFEEGVEWILFDTAEQLKEACDYYLHHEAERVAVANAGKKKVLREHHIGKRVQQIINFYQNGERPFPELEKL